jgi:hypothetical protein
MSTALVKCKSASKTSPDACMQMIDVVGVAEVNKARIGLARSHTEDCGADCRCIQAGARAKMTVLDAIQLWGSASV